MGREFERGEATRMAVAGLVGVGAVVVTELITDTVVTNTPEVASDASNSDLVTVLASLDFERILQTFSSIYQSGDIVSRGVWAGFVGFTAYALIEWYDGMGD